MSEEMSEESSDGVRMRPRRTVRRTALLTAELTAAGLLLAVTLAGCGEKTTQASSTTSPKEQDPAVVIDDRDFSNLASVSTNMELPAEGQPGSGSNPIEYALVNRSVSGQVNIASEDLCANVSMASRGVEYTRNNVSARSALLLVRLPSRRLATMVVACSSAAPEIQPHTSGPGGGGLSVPCPAEFPNVAQWSGGAFFSDAGGRSVGHQVAVVSGGTGSNNDGLWNFEFDNQSASSAKPSLWVVCS